MPEVLFLGEELTQKALDCRLRHHTKAEGFEQGTEAANVTSAVVNLAVAPRHQARHFMILANRPFFFAVRDDHTGNILFMGWVTDPG